MPSFDKFTAHFIDVESEVAGPQKVHAKVCNSGKSPAILLLHGYPQTHYIWRHVVEKLSERYTVVAPDLRGYGQSSKPKGSESHIEYSKREMANDLVQAMQKLGYEQFYILAHDRGARVAHRLALDHPRRVERMMLLDIAPTLWMYEHTDMAFARGYWHWFFLIQPYPQTEDFIAASPQKFWDMLAQRKSHMGGRVWSDEDMEEYQKHYFQPEAIHGACEDYRAAATIDLEHDRSDRENGKKLRLTKLEIIWGAKGMIQTYGDVASIWREYCQESVEVSGSALDCGHYIPEAMPEELLDRALAFFG